MIYVVGGAICLFGAALLRELIRSILIQAESDPFSQREAAKLHALWPD
jgi:hypothetical protein